MMMKDPKKSPYSASNPSKQQSKRVDNIDNRISNDPISTLLSPGFKSVAAMAGWDEEALLLATLIVADTPDRDITDKRRPHSSDSKGKRRSQRRRTDTIPIVALNLDEEETAADKSGPEKKKKGLETDESNMKKEDVPPEHCSSSSSNLLPSRMERLREELCCAICLEICYEPSTTPCGHSFCKKCLRTAVDKCGQHCPKCRQLISRVRSCTINTVLWNTIQLLFPADVEGRKAAATGSGINHEEGHQIHELLSQHDRDVHVRRDTRRAGNATSRSRRGEMPGQDGDEGVILGSISLPNQDEDAALALRVQRQEFMSVIRRSTNGNNSRSILLARSNLRAMASRAINFHMRSRPMQL